MLVIDVGAHDGSAFSIPYSQDPTVVVYAVEPNPQLAEKLRSFNRSNLHVFCTAFGEVDAAAQLYVNRNDQTSSLLRVHCDDAWKFYKEQLEPIQIIDVPVQRLDTFVQAQRITEIDILKIDAQGFDLQVLKGAGKTIHSIGKIQLEVQLQPLYEGSASKEEILEYLGDRGFSLVRCTPQTDGLEENLEFIRVHRYPLTRPESSYFEVQIPYIGKFKTPSSDHVGQLLEQGIFEGAEQAFLWLYLRSGDTFFDCGTHTGLFSVIASHRIGQTGKIFGFDPNPVCFNLYQENLEQLGCENWMVLNVGLSDREGTADLYMGKPGMSAFSTFAVGAVEHPQIGAETVQVPQRSLDSIISEFRVSQVAVAKLDVEGWEAFVLNGAAQSIKSGIFPLWIIEFTEVNMVAAGSSTRELRSLIESLGYTLCRFDSTQLRLVPEPQRSQYPYDNLFAVLNLEAVNNRLATADTEAVAIARDIIVRWDTALQRFRLAHQAADWQTNYERLLKSQQQSEQSLQQTLQTLRVQNQQLKQHNEQLEAEFTYTSTGQAALRKLLKGSLRRLGLYRFAYHHHRIFVPLYNFLSGDRWYPAILKNSNLEQ